jgi:hypothetical protein
MPAKMTPTAMEKAVCTAGVIGDAAATCLTTCLCTACPKEAVACLGDPKCKAVIDCAAATKCSNLTECLKPENCAGAISEAGASLAAALDFQCCGGTCQAMCPPPEGGVPEAGDAAKAETSTDAPAAETGSDAPAAETGSDAAASADADNDGG